MFAAQQQALFPAPVSLMVRESRGGYRAATQDEVLLAAEQLLLDGVKARPLFDQPQPVKDYLRTRAGMLGHEVFLVLYLDTKHRFIECEQLARGTLDQTAVYPREVAKRALHHNAAAVILAHNHPSGDVMPSRADERLTQTLKAALALIDVRVLDHMVVARTEVCSMAERGLV